MGLVVVYALIIAYPLDRFFVLDPGVVALNVFSLIGYVSATIGAVRCLQSQYDPSERSIQ